MSNQEILCNKNNISLIKKFDENEDDIYELYFKCKYDKKSNFFDIINNDGFENLFYELNKDLISYTYREKKNIILNFKNIKKDNDDIILNLKLSKIIKNDNMVSFTYLGNNNTNLILIEYMNYKFELKNDNIYINLTAKFKDDSVIMYDIVMCMYKKCFYRIKEYLEL